MDAVNSFIEWVVTTPFSLFLQSRLWVIPTVQTVHILCVAIVLTAAAMIDLRLLGLIARGQSIAALSRRFLPAAWVALVILAFTGSLLIIAEPARSLLALPFQLKMLMLVTVILLTVIFQRAVAANASRWDRVPAAPAARITAAVSLGLWLAIIVAGRWIAYAELG